MALTRNQKQKIVDDLKEKIERQKLMAFIDFTGLKVKDLSALRKKIKAAGGNLKVIKKTLIKLVLGKAGLKLGEDLQGEIAVVFSFEDEIAPLKEVYQLSKSNEHLKILSAIFGGEFIGKEKALILAQIPGRQELLGKLVGSIASPMSGFVNVLQGNLRNFVYVLSQISLKVNQ